MRSAHVAQGDVSTDGQIVDLHLARLSLQGKIALLGQRQAAAERIGLPAMDLTVHQLTEDVSTAFPLPLGLISREQRPISGRKKSIASPPEPLLGPKDLLPDPKDLLVEPKALLFRP